MEAMEHRQKFGFFNTYGLGLLIYNISQLEKCLNYTQCTHGGMKT